MSPTVKTSSTCTSASPRRNGLRDDVQLLWSGSALNNYIYISPTTSGRATTSPSTQSFGTHTGRHLRSRNDRARADRERLHEPDGQSAYLQPELLYWERFQGLRPDVCLPGSSGFACGSTYHGLRAITSRTTCRSERRSRRARRRQGAAASTTRQTRRRIHSMAAIPLDRQLAKRQPERYRHHEGAVHLRVEPIGVSARIRLHVLLGLARERARASARTALSPYPRSRRREYQLITHTAGGALDFQDQLNDQNLLTPRRELHDRRRDPLQ